MQLDLPSIVWKQLVGTDITENVGLSFNHLLAVCEAMILILTIALVSSVCCC